MPFDFDYEKQMREGVRNVQDSLLAITNDREAKEKRAKRYRHLIIALSIIMAIGAALAALPVVLDLISKVR